MFVRFHVFLAHFFGEDKLQQRYCFGKNRILYESIASFFDQFMLNCLEEFIGENGADENSPYPSPVTDFLLGDRILPLTAGSRFCSSPSSPAAAWREEELCPEPDPECEWPFSPLNFAISRNSKRANLNFRFVIIFRFCASEVLADKIWNVNPVPAR